MQRCYTPPSLSSFPFILEYVLQIQWSNIPLSAIDIVTEGISQVILSFPEQERIEWLQTQLADGRCSLPRLAALLKRVPKLLPSGLPPELLNSGVTEFILTVDVQENCHSVVNSSFVSCEQWTACARQLLHLLIPNAFQATSSVLARAIHFACSGCETALQLLRDFVLYSGLRAMFVRSPFSMLVPSPLFPHSWTVSRPPFYAT